MKLTTIHTNPVRISLLLMVALTIAVVAGSHFSRLVQIEKANVVLKNRIALDLFELGLSGAPEQMTESNNVVKTYIIDLNQYLAEVNFPLRVSKISHYAPVSETPANTKIIELNSARRTIPVAVYIVSPRVYWWAFVVPPMLSALFFMLLRINRRNVEYAGQAAEIENIDIPPKLIIDLRDKTLYLDSDSELKAALSNKPLCFYLAMLTFCSQSTEPQLFHTKQLPEDFISLANKYFSRLLELGHSRRKRPDFDNNIDKMLSEIRTALDEIMAEQPDLKSIYFPQKAQGEGSRSKLHNFALSAVSQDNFEIIGN